MVKDMEDDTRALGLFNRWEFPVEVTAQWAMAGVSGRQAVRDLWHQKDIGIREGSLSITVLRPGAALLRLRPVGN